MKFIKVRNTEEIVKIKIMIEYVGPSKYSYAISSSNSFDYKSSNTPPKPFPHLYDIGMGKVIILKGNHFNSVAIQLINPSSQVLDYKLFINWYQGDDVEPIYTWPKTAKEQNGKFAGPLFILSSDFMYKKI